ncbi:hypothetical protein D3C72_1186920 [compost metagenome]
MRLHRFAAVANALAHHIGAHQASHTGVDVHHGAAGEVQRTLGVQQARRRFGCEPHHMGDRHIGEGEPDHGEHQHRREAGAFGEAAHDQCAGDAGERGLERGEQQLGQGVRHGVGAIRRCEHAREEGARQAAEEGVALGEREGVSIDEPENQAQHERAQHLQQHGQHVLAAYQAAIEHRQTGYGHHQYKQGRDEQPGDICFIHFQAPMSLYLFIYSAASPASPVRIRITCSRGAAKILPSPILPVRAACSIASMT